MINDKHLDANGSLSRRLLCFAPDFRPGLKGGVGLGRLKHEGFR